MATHTQDDYLVCSEYEEQIGSTSAEHPGFITFKHANGNHYFAWVNDGHIVMRSEAYPDADKMQRGIAAILKNCDLPERYRIDEQHGAHFLCLMGGGDHQAHTGNLENHSEIGRSCPRKTREELHASLLFKGKDFADKVVHLSAPAAAAPAEVKAPVAEVKETIVEKAAPIAAAAATVAATAAAAATSSSSEKTTASYASSTSTQVAETASTGGGMGWLKWLLPLLLLGAFAYWWKSCRGATTDAAAGTEIVADAGATISATPTDTGAVAAVAPVVAGAVESMKVKLMDGVEINANKGGIESKLVALLDDKNAAFNAEDKKANWYDFDNLNFDLGKSTITAASQVQIDNLVAILKAYPALKIKVGGYTDKKGDDNGNMKLSQSRADAVMAALKAKGANAAQITGAEGYGEQFAIVAETESDEARRVDRRTAVRVMAK